MLGGDGADMLTKQNLYDGGSFAETGVCSVATCGIPGFIFFVNSCSIKRSDELLVMEWDNLCLCRSRRGSLDISFYLINVIALLSQETKNSQNWSHSHFS